MTLVFFDGLQDAALMLKPEWDPSTAGWNPDTGRDGSTNGAARFIGLPTNTTRVKTLTLPSAAATCLVGLAHLSENFRISPGHFIVGFVRSGTTEVVVLINSGGFIEVRRTDGSGTLLGTSSGHAPIITNSWHHFQVKALLHTSTGVVEVRLDGVTVISLSGIATAGTSGSVTAVSFSVNANAGNSFYDDMWVCDAVDATATQGRPNNDFLGDLKVTSLIPSANGDLTAWTKSTGTNAAALVDEVPPNTTDYILSATAAQRELMALPDLPAATTDVYGVRVCIYALKTDAGARSVKPLVKEVSGGTITAQTAIPLTTSYAALHGALLFTVPSAPTTPWSESDINGLQAGVELV